MTPLREHQTVAAVRELARQIAVAGDDRREAREVGVRGVGRQREDRRGRELQEPEDEVVAEHLLAHLGEHGDHVARYGRKWCARTETPRNSEPRIVAIHVSVVAAFFDSGRRNAGTPLEIASTPVSATAPDEKPAQEDEQAQRIRRTRFSRRASALSGRTGSGWIPPNQPNHVLVSPRTTIAVTMMMYA